MSGENNAGIFEKWNITRKINRLATAANGNPEIREAKGHDVRQQGWRFNSIEAEMVKKREIEISRRRFFKMELFSPAPGPIVWSEPTERLNRDSQDLNMFLPIFPQGKVVQNPQHPSICRLAHAIQYSAEDHVQAKPRTTEKGMKVNDRVHLETKPGMIETQPHGNETILPVLVWKPLAESGGIRSMRLSLAAGARCRSNSTGTAAE